METASFSILEAQLSSVLNALSSIPEHHYPSSPVYKHFSLVANYCANNIFGENKPQFANLDFIGEIKMPYFSMGAINSTHLFGLDELILFSFYNNSKNLYKKVSDLGGNIGLHSIVLSKLGFQVTSYEPDPIHINRMEYNISQNSLTNKPVLINKAVSTTEGEVEFTRVVGNTTGSHISGAKENPYGELEKISVKTESFTNIMMDSDLIKIDVEGHEANIIAGTKYNDWDKVDALVKVGTKKNAEIIYKHLFEIKVKMFSQKIGWQEVKSLKDMPNSYKDGSLFITTKESMPWKV